MLVSVWLYDQSVLRAFVLQPGACSNNNATQFLRHTGAATWNGIPSLWSVWSVVLRNTKFTMDCDSRIFSRLATSVKNEVGKPSVTRLFEYISQSFFYSNCRQLQMEMFISNQFQYSNEYLDQIDNSEKRRIVPRIPYKYCACEFDRKIHKYCFFQVEAKPYVQFEHERTIARSTLRYHTFPSSSQRML